MGWVLDRSCKLLGPRGGDAGEGPCQQGPESTVHKYYRRGLRKSASQADFAGRCVSPTRLAAQPLRTPRYGEPVARTTQESILWSAALTEHLIGRFVLAEAEIPRMAQL